MERIRKIRLDEVLPDIRWETIAPPYLNYDYFRGSDLYPFRFDATAFDPVNAWWLIEASTLAYSEENFAREGFRRAGLQEIRFFSGPGTQCYVASNSDFVIVAFRGTEIRKRDETSDFMNIVADLRTDFDILLVDSGHGGKVHRGFKEALDEVWEKQGLLDYIRSRDDDRRSIWFTGHSLGAALATLAADRYGNVTGLYTYGSPRVGDESFKRDFHIDAYRVVNNSDIVATIPPEGFYHHVGDLKYIDSNGRLHDNPGEWARLADGILGKISRIFDSIGRFRSVFAPFIPDDIIDHVPVLYAAHIRNNILFGP
jgi:triacylglycerol lipase